MVLIFLLVFIYSNLDTSVYGGSPPGIRPPLSFHAEDWYPKDLPTVAPPWKKQGVDIRSFQTTESTTRSAVNTVLTTVVSQAISLDKNETIIGIPSLADDDFTVDSNTTDVTDIDLLNIVMNQKESSQELQDFRKQRVDITGTEDMFLDGPQTIFNASESIFSTESMELNTTTTENNTNTSEVVSDVVMMAITTPMTTTLTISSVTDKIPIITTPRNDVEAFNNDVLEHIEIKVQESSNDTMKTTSVDNTINTDIESINPVETIIEGIAPNDLLANLTTSPLHQEDIQTSTTMTITTVTTTRASDGSLQDIQHLFKSSSTSLNLRQFDDPQKNSSKECSDLVFAIDSSGNVEEQYEKQKQLVHDIIRGIGTIHRRMSLMTYAGRRRQRWNIPLHLNLTTESFLKKLSRARFLSGITETGAAIENIIQELEHQNSNNATIVFLTDGFSFDRIDVAAEKLRNRSGVTVYATGNYFPIVRAVLESLSSADNVRFGAKAINHLISELQC